MLYLQIGNSIRRETTLNRCSHFLTEHNKTFFSLAYFIFFTVSLACAGVHEVLCQIQGIFLDMAIDPSRDLDITPFILDKFIKLNHWLVYREYENLMDYSHKLLKIITGDKKHIVK